MSGQQESRTPFYGAALTELSGLELEVMNLVWKLGECTSADVIEAYNEVRPLADTTIRTVLTNIRRKGYLELVPSIDRGYRMKPKIPQHFVAKRTLQSLISKVFDGSPRLAIEVLLHDDRLDERDLDEIRAMVEQRRKDLGNGGTSHQVS